MGRTNGRRVLTNPWHLVRSAMLRADEQNGPACKAVWQVVMASSITDLESVHPPSYQILTSKHISSSIYPGNTLPTIRREYLTKYKGKIMQNNTKAHKLLHCMISFGKQFTNVSLYFASATNICRPGNSSRGFLEPEFISEVSANMRDFWHWKNPDIWHRKYEYKNMT